MPAHVQYSRLILSVGICDFNTSDSTRSLRTLGVRGARSKGQLEINLSSNLRPADKTQVDFQAENDGMATASDHSQCRSSLLAICDSVGHFCLLSCTTNCRLSPWAYIIYCCTHAGSSWCFLFYFLHSYVNSTVCKLCDIKWFIIKTPLFAVLVVLLLHYNP